MAVRLFNNLSKKKELFKPLKRGRVGFYGCGPTVYDYAHIGNLRTYVFGDILRRTMEYNGYKVKQVMNITDVGHLVSDSDEGEDKMTKALKRESKPLTLEAMKSLADFYAEEFKKDLTELNIEAPQIMPKASEHINEQIKIIKKLWSKKIAYKTSDGIYFDISKFKKYGKLGKLKIEKENRARIDINSEKKNPQDFALWKFNPNLGWESPWGKGFPGWHIECSAMATKYLGQPFDIHTGGIDLIPTHHQNEIAQSEAAYDKPLANYWLHGEFVVIGKDKMAKSGGNFITLKTIKEKGIPPLAYRYLILNSHYRSPLNFTDESLAGAQNGLNNLYGQIKNLGVKIGKPDKKLKEKFLSAINDDLNTAKALATLQEALKSKLTNEAKLATALDFDKVLGLRFKDTFDKMTGLTKMIDKSVIPNEIQKLADERKKAKDERNYPKADKIREKILGAGYEVKDLPDGTSVYYKK